MALSKVEIQTTFVVKNTCNGKTPWLVTSQQVEGDQYVLLDKWNRDFTKFVTGKALDLRNCDKTSINNDFFDNLLVERNSKSKDAVREATQVDEEHGSSSTVEIILPEVSFGDAEFKARSVRALWGVKSTELWVFLDADVLEHIRMGILESLNNKGRPSRKRVTGTSQDPLVSETQTTTSD